MDVPRILNLELSVQFALHLSPGFPELRDSPHELGHDRAVFPGERRPPAVGANSSRYLSNQPDKCIPLDLGTAQTAAVGRSPAWSGGEGGSLA